METRVATVSIIVENGEKVDEINAILHAYAPYIIGRMGLPYREKNICIISIAMDAPEDEIRCIFSRAKKLFDEYKESGATVLSMGMSGDYEIAVQEKSTIVRIGTLRLFCRALMMK